MKRLFTIILTIAISSLFAQQEIFKKVGEGYIIENITKKKTIKEANGMVWLNDSIYSFRYNYGDNNLNRKAYHSYSPIDGNVIQTIELLLDSETSIWKNYLMSDYTYDINGNQIQIIQQLWSSATTSWKNRQKSDYVYDLNNKLVQQIDQLWEEEEWNDFQKADYSYYTNGNLLQVFYQLWNPDINTWGNYYKLDCIYDANGNRTLIIGTFWDSDTNLWEDWISIDYEYDLNGNMIEYILKLWDSEENSFVNNTKGTYTYDINNNLTQTFYEFWNYGTSGWDDWYWDDYYWSEYNINSVITIGDDNIYIYPNPASNILNIKSSKINKFSRIEIFSMSGKKIKPVSGDIKEINISNLPHGVYFVKFYTENEVFSKRFIKK